MVGPKGADSLVENHILADICPDLVCTVARGPFAPSVFRF